MVSLPGGITCSGTAVAEHAILTADHCNYGDESLQMKLDRSTRVYNILGAVHDGRDHVIYILDGPKFTVVDPLLQRPPVIGEKVYIYGFGMHRYPAVRKEGVVVDEYDPSEIDRGQAMVYTSIQVIPGDSGSAVYAQDGTVLGLVTWSTGAEGILLDKHGNANFSLGFTPAQLDNIRSVKFKEKHDSAKLPGVV